VRISLAARGRGLTTVVVLALLGCGGGGSPTDSGGQPTSASVLFVYTAATAPRTDLPNTVDVQRCVILTGPTHIHLGWRNFELRNLAAAGPTRWEVRVEDVPVNTRTSIQAADPNTCDVPPFSGYVHQNVTANGVALAQRVPGPAADALAFTVSPTGQVTP
jgi:hypothetical protein